MMVHRILVLAVALLVSPGARAQTEPVEKGSHRDLRGAATVFIDPDVQTEHREAIVANLKTELPQVTVVDRVEDAALVIRFSTTLGSESLSASRDRAENSASEGPSDMPVKPALRQRLPPGNRPDIPDTSRSSSRSLDDVESGTLQPRSYRYAVGSILKPYGPNRFIEPVSFKRKLGSDTNRAVRDFVRKFAKAYRKANALEN